MVDRREFLTRSGAAVAAASLPVTVATALVEAAPVAVNSVSFTVTGLVGKSHVFISDGVTRKLLFSQEVELVNEVTAELPAECEGKELFVKVCQSGQVKYEAFE